MTLLVSLMPPLRARWKVFVCGTSGLVAVVWSAFGLQSTDYASSHDILQSPSPRHWLGTNDIGQDVAIGLVQGIPATIVVPLVIAFFAVLIAGLVAALAAVRGGVVDAVVLRIVEILQIFPSMFILLLLTTWIRPGFAGIVILLTVTSWHDDVRILRAVFRREMQRESLLFVRVIGAGWTYCICRHVLPAVWPSITAVYVQNVRSGVMKVAGLGFLGIVDPRMVTWGGMMRDAMPHLFGEAWLWLLLPPVVALCLFLAVIVVVGARLEQKSLVGAI